MEVSDGPRTAARGRRCPVRGRDRCPGLPRRCGDVLIKEPMQPNRGGMVSMYEWIVLLHIVGAFVFVLSHGVAVFVAYELPKQRDSGRIVALLDVSGTSLNGAYLGLLLLLIGGIWAGIYRDWFKSTWIWAALVVFVLITVVMYLVATPYFKRL